MTANTVPSWIALFLGIALCSPLAQSVANAEARADASVERYPQGRKKNKKKKEEQRSPDDVEGDRFDFPDQGLTLVFTGLDGFVKRDIPSGAAGGQLRARWNGVLEEREIDINLWVFEN